MNFFLFSFYVDTEKSATIEVRDYFAKYVVQKEELSKSFWQMIIIDIIKI